MRKLRGAPNDSLDLLLDTLCNVFGGIILIACLLALLTRDQTDKIPMVATTSHGQLLERRIEAASNEVTGLKALLAELNREGDSDLRRLASERDALKLTLDRLQREKARIQKEKAQEASATFLDPGRELTALRRQVQRNQAELETATSKIAATTEKQHDLTERLSRLQGAIRESESKRIVKLRFPKERSKTKGAFPVILRHGQIYPVSETFPGLDTTIRGASSIEVTPIPGLGFELPKHQAKVQALIATCMQEGGYVTIYVYPDSFECFRALKSVMHDAGCDYGIEVCDDPKPLRFGSSGRAPNPL